MCVDGYDPDELETCINKVHAMAYRGEESIPFRGSTIWYQR